MTASQYLTVREAAALLRLNHATVYRAIADGRLPHIQLGKRGAIRIPVAELEAMVKQ